MTKWLDASQVAATVAQRFPNAIVAHDGHSLTVAADELVAMATFLRADLRLDLEYLVSLTAVDRLDHFELVYHLQSLSHNHLLVLKTIAPDHEAPEVPSVVSIWQGAHLQERELYDLMGIRFRGHPDQRRLFLWDGFPGHPLRKDFLHLPGGLQPGLQKFPREEVPEQAP